MATITDGRTIPFDWYSNPDVLRLERERIFRSAWQYAGRADQVAEPGSFFACDAGGVPVVVVRDKEGALRAFLNVCRHRGSLVCEGEGRRETLQCPYHAWTYGLDGSLRAAPRTEREPGFDKVAARARAPCRSTPGGRSSSSTRTPRRAAARGAPRRAARARRRAGLDLGSLRFLKRATSEYEANWKVCCENFLECYHCQIAHPGFSKVVDVSVDAYAARAERHFSTQYGPVREAWKGDFDPRGPVARGQFHFLWPNITINVMPGQPNLSIGPVVPLAAERTARFLDYFVGPDVETRGSPTCSSSTTRSAPRTPSSSSACRKGCAAAASSTAGCCVESERLIAHFQSQLVDALA